MTTPALKGIEAAPADAIQRGLDDCGTLLKEQGGVEMTEHEA